jgi:ribosomal protein S18 acetylase RimI-like enzyme
VGEGEKSSLVTLRPVRWPEDEAFLQALYASTRADELAQVPWSEEQKADFCRMQFAAQHQHYQEHYAGASYDVIELGRRPIGRLYVARWPEEIRVIDIALLPQHRCRGIGTGLLQRVLAEGDATEKPVSIHVEQFNPALRLYERLGFQKAAEVGVYFLLKRPPGNATPKNHLG